jgi:hypothetical protein
VVAPYLCVVYFLYRNDVDCQLIPVLCLANFGLALSQHARQFDAMGMSARDVLGHKSTSGTVVLKNGAPLAWKSKLQTTVATSTCEAECAAAAQTVKEGLWTRKLMEEISGTVEPVKVYCDNQSALKLMTLEPQITVYSLLQPLYSV